MDNFEWQETHVYAEQWYLLERNWYEKGIQVTGQRNPFEQILHGSRKFFAFFFVVDMVALKMNIATPTRELSRVGFL